MVPERIAHRGASGTAPENTMAAFRRALELGARSIEFDVQQTRDGRLVIIHDEDLRRVCGVRRRLAALSFEELRGLDAGGWFDPRFRGERVPALEELLDLAAGRIELQLEIKNGARPYPGIEERVLAALGARPEWRGRVVVSSFNHDTLYKVRALDPSARLGYLVGLTRRSTALREAAELGCESVHMSARQVDAAWVRALHDAGRRVLVYTVNTAKELGRLARLGVDAVFTNFPDLAVPSEAPSR